MNAPTGRVRKADQAGQATPEAAEASSPSGDHPSRMELWNAVSKTDPRHTKKVNQRGGFTAISAHYQVMSATAAFGPVGIGWGYVNGEPIWHDNLVVIPVTLWHGKRENAYGPVYGAAEWKSGNRIDSDATKKAATDGLTKALSHLGFNADVFLGRFDDNKYVAELTKEFTAADEPPVAEVTAKDKDGDLSPSALKAALRIIVHDINGCGDIGDLDALLEDPDRKPVLEQCQRRAPAWWETGEGMPAEFIPLSILIKRRKLELEELDSIKNRQRTVLDAG